MASYGLKYRKIWDNELELNIYQRQYTGAVSEIGEVQSLNLQLDGDEDPCKPIMKTILTFTLVDTPDMKHETGVKHGNWEEFYTPDSTLYKVEIVDGGETEWTGYITPDNWEESLDYRGSITITARDNIGHLQDFEWDDSPLPTAGDGLLSLYECLHGAMDLIEMPMIVEYKYASRTNRICIDPQEQGTDIDSFCINTKACEGKSIYDIMEKMLESLGLCLRYTGYNVVCIDYLRYLPYYNNPGVYPIDIDFLIGGSRKKVPPYKKIIDTVKYGQDDEAKWDFKKGYNPGTNSTYTGKIYYDSQSSSGSTQVSGKYAVNNNNGDIGWSGTGFLNPSGLLLSNEKDMVLLAANVTSGNPVQAYGFGIIRNPAVNIEINIVGNMYTQLLWLYKYSKSYLSEFNYGVRYNVNGKNYYWNGDVWTDNISTLKFKSDTEIESITINLSNKLSNGNSIPGYGKLRFLFDGITFRLSEMPNNIFGLYNGVYMAVTGISLRTPDNLKTLEKDTVTTVVNEKYNIIDKRDTDFGPLSQTVDLISPDNYENALYYRSNYTDGFVEPVPYNLQWGDGTAQPFPSIRHKQYLMYHGSDEEILEGEILAKDGYRIWLDRCLRYNGKTYAVLSGNLDLLTGRVSGVVLRSFKLYEDLWDD